MPLLCHCEHAHALCKLGRCKTLLLMHKFVFAKEISYYIIKAFSSHEYEASRMLHTAVLMCFLCGLFRLSRAMEYQ